jgi:hypothetical protein
MYNIYICVRTQLLLSMTVPIKRHIYASKMLQSCSPPLYEYITRRAPAHPGLFLEIYISEEKVSLCSSSVLLICTPFCTPKIPDARPSRHEEKKEEGKRGKEK